jgi:TonB family protein
MALTGQLSDMSLAELIEFFCNQRKTGRLKIDYPRGHSVFFIKEGELVDAKVGSLSGPEAVYFSLTLPNAAFDFSPDVQATRRTIHSAWTQVVLEGLRRLDEGLAPTEADAFGTWSPNESELAQMLDQVEHLDAAGQQKSARDRDKFQREKPARAARPADDSPAADSPARGSSAEPFSMMVESAGGGSKKKFVVAGVAAAVVLACAAAAVPLLKSPAAKPAAADSAAAAAPAPAAPAEAAPAEAAPAEAAPEDATTPNAEASAAAADAARREERERRERERRERERREDAAAKRDELTSPDAAAAAKPAAPAAPSGPKSVRVSVSYDEAGRVTQASVAGATAGAEAYGSTAVRIARGKRFPAGKPGSTVITIPVN